jgi:transcriptional regulator with XRE-family HTH domain
MRGDYSNRVRGKLPQAIRSIRFRLGLTGQDFGRLIGVRQPVLSAFECGIRKPFLPALLRILARASNEERSVLERELSRFRITTQELKAAAGCCTLPDEVYVRNLNAESEMAVSNAND